MERTQADAIAKAILGPDLRTQEQICQKRIAETAYLSRKRKVAWFALAGSGIGAGVAYLIGVQFPIGVVWGGLASSIVGWLVTRRSGA